MSTRRTLTTIAAAAVLAVPGLTACGSGSGSGGDYCDTLKSVKEDKSLEKLDPSKNPADMKKAVDVFQKVTDAAPSEVKKEWGEVTTMMRDVSNIDMEAVKKDPAKAAEMMKKLDFTKLTTDMEKITKDAKDRCKIDLNSKS